MSQVEDFYNAQAEREWQRLERRHRTEFAVTLRALDEFLPPAPARVADIGGGPGQYTLALTRRGYAVTLVDLAQANLDLAARKAEEAGLSLQARLRRDARDLQGLPDGGFEVVLLMGPLYHLLEREDRARAVREALRVSRPGGLLAAAFLSRYAAIRDIARTDPLFLAGHLAEAEHMISTGRLEQPENFAPAYFARPEEIAPFMESLGLTTLRLIGCEGVAAGQEEKLNLLEGPIWDLWVDLNYRLGCDPALLGAADHLLYLGRVPA